MVVSGNEHRLVTLLALADGASGHKGFGVRRLTRSVQRVSTANQRGGGLSTSANTRMTTHVVTNVATMTAVMSLQQPVRGSVGLLRIYFNQLFSVCIFRLAFKFNKISEFVRTLNWVTVVVIT
jgi:hypothetical protein